jgi:hypothetical protein
MLEVVLGGIADDDVGEVVIGFHLFHSVQFLAAIDLNRQRYDIFLKHGMVMRSVCFGYKKFNVFLVTTLRHKQ